MLVPWIERWCYVFMSVSSLKQWKVLTSGGNGECYYYSTCCKKGVGCRAKRRGRRITAAKSCFCKNFITTYRNMMMYISVYCKSLLL